MDITPLLDAFEHLYREQAPLRYATLQPGYTFTAVEHLCAQLQVDALPEEYIALYAWKNGMQDLAEGWESEFEEDAWYEILPLDSSNHFVSIEKAVMLADMWHAIKAEKDAANEPSYWKDGFIPLLEDQNFGLLAVDTRGYFQGRAGQLIYFDYKDSGGYTIAHRDIAKWLETNIALLKSGVFFVAETAKDVQMRIKIETRINERYTKRFANPISFG